MKEIIELPPVIISDKTECYGAYHIASRYCGYNGRPETPFVEWQHGWIKPQRNINPEFVVGSDGLARFRKHARFLVARKDQETYLREEGFTDVHAVGLPIIYLPRLSLRRIPNSLLIMPTHTTRTLYETGDQWNGHNYTYFLSTRIKNFSHVSACIYAACLEVGNWMPGFQSMGIDIIRGADPKDICSLLRMAMLFSQFEYLTTNVFGSHVAYASYFGCKVSVIGPKAPFLRENHSKHILSQNVPEYVEYRAELHKSEKVYKEYFPEFVCEPGEAVKRQEWGAWQLGEQCKRSPKQLAKLLRFDESKKSNCHVGFDVEKESSPYSCTNSTPSLVNNTQNRLNGFSKVHSRTPIILINGYRVSSPTLPTGLGYVAQALEDAEIDYYICDVNIESKEQIIALIKDLKPTYVGLGSMTFEVEKNYQLLNDIKSILPNTIIILGGPHAIAAEDAIFIECPAIDIVIQGEGEKAIVKLLQGCDTRNIAGILTRNSEYCGPRFTTLDINTISFPKYTWFKLAQYGNTMNLASSRGCVYQCTFCGAPKFLGKKWRAFSAEHIIEEFNYWYEKGYRNFYFSDSLFALNKQRIIDFCRYISNSYIKDVCFTADGIRADHLDIEVLHSMKAANFIHLTFGLESTNNKTLDFFKKGTTFEEMDKGIRLADKLGFDIQLYLIVGAPTDNYSDTLRSLYYPLCLSNVTSVIVSKLLPIKGTSYYQYALDHGLVKNHDEHYPSIEAAGFNQHTDSATQVEGIWQLFIPVINEVTSFLQVRNNIRSLISVEQHKAITVYHLNQLTRTHLQTLELDQRRVNTLLNETLSEIIRRRNPDNLVNELISSGIPCKNLQINIEDFVNFLKVFPKLSLHYSQYGDVHIEKCLEHYLAYKILNLSSGKTYIDIAASGSRWSDYLLEHSIDAYSLDLSYPPGTHGRKIGANAAATDLPDDSIDAMSLQCAFETFRSDNDILFVKEASRILKEGGAVLVLPLYLDPVHFIMSSKDTDLSTAPLDEGAIRVWREDEYQEAFSRHYSPQALLERIFKNLGDLTAEVIYIPNLEELRQVFPGQRIYCDFLLLIKKPCLTKKSTIFDAILSPVSDHRLSIDPDSIFTHLTQDEKHTLKNLATNINGKVFVELGSYLGASSYYIASGLTNKPDAKLYCIDTWQNDAMSEGKRDTYCEFLCNIKPFSNFIVPLRDTTTNAALNFRQNIDFLFIDAGHDYEDVYNDVTHWLPKLNHGATVVFHDIGWAEGVKRVVNENIKPIAFNEGNLPNMYWAQIYTLNLSVIIPTRNRAALLYNTLDSLTRQTYPQHLFETIVVDNGSTDNTPDVCQYFKRRLPNLTYISDPRPGLHNGRHTGYEAAKGDILVYGDDDIEALPTWLEGIAESFADESVGIVGGKNLPKFEVTPPAWVDDLKIAYKNGWWLGSYSILDFGDEVQEIRHELVWGCNFSIRKELLKQAGGFHPDSVPQELIKYRGDGETAVSAAVRNLGYRAVYNPKASVYHVVSATRLTPDYIYTRMFNQGVSDSYTSIRKTGGFTPARLYGPASGNIHEVVNRGLVDGFNWHQQAVQADPALLEWVLRDNYMGEKGAP